MSIVIEERCKSVLTLSEAFLCSVLAASGLYDPINFSALPSSGVIRHRQLAGSSLLLPYFTQVLCGIAASVMAADEQDLHSGEAEALSVIFLLDPPHHHTSQKSSGATSPGPFAPTAEFVLDLRGLRKPDSSTWEEDDGSFARLESSVISVLGQHCGEVRTWRAAVLSGCVSPERIPDPQAWLRLPDPPIEPPQHAMPLMSGLLPLSGVGYARWFTKPTPASAVPQQTC